MKMLTMIDLRNKMIKALVNFCVCQKTYGLRECPAYGKKCKKCGIKNHFAIACKIKNVKSTISNYSNKCNNEASSNSSVTIESIATIKSTKYNKYKSIWEEYLQIENTRFKVKLDTVADVNIIPKNKFKKLGRIHKIRQTECILKAFEGTVSKPISIVNLNIKYKNRVNFVVVENANQILLGGHACVRLGLIKRIHIVNINVDKDKEKFINENLEIFKGSSRLPQKCEIVTNTKFEPVCHTPSRIPLAIIQPLQAELERLVKRNAIAKVDVIDPRASINEIVIVEKGNGKIRLCLDPLDHKHIVRKPRIGETMEEICAKFLNIQLFTVFDLSEGFHQIEIDENSS